MLSFFVTNIRLGEETLSHDPGLRTHSRVNSPNLNAQRTHSMRSLRPKTISQRAIPNPSNRSSTNNTASNSRSSSLNSRNSSSSDPVAEDMRYTLSGSSASLVDLPPPSAAAPTERFEPEHRALLFPRQISALSDISELTESIRSHSESRHESTKRDRDSSKRDSSAKRERDPSARRERDRDRDRDREQHEEDRDRDSTPSSRELRNSHKGRDKSR